MQFSKVMTEIHFGHALINMSKILAIIITGGGLSPQMNKFEQVSSDEYQMSVVGGGLGLMCGIGGMGIGPNASWVIIP